MSSNVRKSWVDMLRIFIIFLIFISSSNVYALTLKSGGTVKSGGAGSTLEQTSVTKLNTELVTRKREASSLSDDELCLSLTKLDLPSTFYEHQKRGLNCLAIQNAQERWTTVTRETAFKHLKIYQKKYNVVAPAYSLKNVSQNFGLAKKTAELYQLLNPNFQNLYFNKGIETGEISYHMQFCLDWFGNVNYVAENQSKSLDGSFSWKDDTLRDGFVICQDTFNEIYLRALTDENIRQQMEQMLLAWINNDRLRRDVKTGNDIFGQILLFNKATIAIEMFHESFGWSDAQNAKLSEWLNRRAVEMFPSDRWPVSIKCPTNPRDSNFNSFEACQNGGILRAQALLRVGIWNNDSELVEMAYVAFHRYMTGIREDGSNITDSARGCAAADYNIWASQFMSDFMFHWSRISEPLWDVQFNGVATPAVAVEYSLSLLGNFEAVNKHTTPKSWGRCGDYKIDKTQEATKRYEEETYYPRAAFAPYFLHKGTLVEILFQYDRSTESTYTAQSGANYEIALLGRLPKIGSDLNTKAKEAEAEEKRMLQAQIAEARARLKQRAEKIRQKEREMAVKFDQLQNQIIAQFNLKSGTQFRRQSDEYSIPFSKGLILFDERQPELRQVSGANELSKISAQFSVRLEGDNTFPPPSFLPVSLSAFSSLISLMENTDFFVEDTISIGVATSQFYAAEAIATVNKQAIKKCGSLPRDLNKRGAYEWVFVALKTKDDLVKKQQDCALGVFLSQDEDVAAFYKGLIMLAPHLELYARNYAQKL